MAKREMMPNHKQIKSNSRRKPRSASMVSKLGTTDSLVQSPANPSHAKIKKKLELSLKVPKETNLAKELLRLLLMTKESFMSNSQTISNVHVLRAFSQKACTFQESTLLKSKFVKIWLLAMSYSKA